MSWMAFFNIGFGEPCPEFPYYLLFLLSFPNFFEGKIGQIGGFGTHDDGLIFFFNIGFGEPCPEFPSISPFSLSFPNFFLKEK